MKKSFKSRIALFMSVLSCACALQGAFANPLHDAVKEGNQLKIARLARENPELMDEYDCFDITTEVGESARKYQLNESEGSFLTPLEFATYKNDKDAVRLMLEIAESRRTACDVDDCKAHLLNIAAACNNVEMAKFLIDNGAKINRFPKHVFRTDKHVVGANFRYAPLHVAAHYGNKEMVSFLISRGADIYLKNDDGKTPIDVARCSVLGFNFCSRTLSTAARSVGRVATKYAVLVALSPFALLAPPNSCTGDCFGVAKGVVDGCFKEHDE